MAAKKTTGASPPSPLKRQPKPKSAPVASRTTTAHPLGVDVQAKVPSERPGRPGGRRDTNRKERTTGLTDAAVELFLADGIEAVTIEDITTRAGVAKGTFYRYFDDKGAIVESILAPVYAAVVDSFNQSLGAIAAARTPEAAAAAYDVLASGLVELILHHGDAALLYLQENRGPSRGARAPVMRIADVLADKAIQHTEAIRAHGLLKPFPSELSTLAVIGAAERLLYAALSGHLKTELLDVPALLINLILDGIRDPAAKAILGKVA
jgi:AcrR family transcriptional regulator